MEPGVVSLPGVVAVELRNGDDALFILFGLFMSNLRRELGLDVVERLRDLGGGDGELHERVLLQLGLFQSARKVTGLEVLWREEDLARTLLNLAQSLSHGGIIPLIGPQLMQSDMLVHGVLAAEDPGPAVTLALLLLSGKRWATRWS